eukprot:6456968-Amphidinium_carterae.3
MQYLRNQADSEHIDEPERKGRNSKVFPCIIFGDDRLRVVPSYHYLGRWVAAKPALQQEFDLRKARCKVSQKTRGFTDQGTSRWLLV